MKKVVTLVRLTLIMFSLSTIMLVSCAQQPTVRKSLAEAYAGKFYIGTALNDGHITGNDTAGVRVIKENFNAIVAENCMKIEEIHELG